MAYELHMDYDGQQRAETYSRCVIALFGAIGFIIGYYQQLFSYTVYSLGVGFLIACIVSIVPWPIYRRKPLKWRKPKNKTEGAPSKDETVSDKQKKKK